MSTFPPSDAENRFFARDSCFLVDLCEIRWGPWGGDDEI